MKIPSIDAKELERFIFEVLPEAAVTLKTINPHFGSWLLEIRSHKLWVEYSWGPLTGFGFSDMDFDNENPFAPCDVALWSMQEAQQKLRGKTGEVERR